MVSAHDAKEHARQGRPRQAHRTGIASARQAFRDQVADLGGGIAHLAGAHPLELPARYVREYTPHTPAGYLPQFQPTEFPRVAHDLRETVLRSRRPELYQP